MSKDNEPGTNQDCRCIVTLRAEHLQKLTETAESINESLQLTTLRLDAGHVLQLLLNQHLDKISTELVEFSRCKAIQQGKQIEPKTTTYTFASDRKTTH